MELKSPKKKRLRSPALYSPLPVCNDKLLTVYNLYEWPIFTGQYNGTSVIIQDPSEIIALSSKGFFGKGSLSKASPAIVKKKQTGNIICESQWKRRKCWIEEVMNENVNQDASNSSITGTANEEVNDTSKPIEVKDTTGVQDNLNNEAADTSKNLKVSDVSENIEVSDTSSKIEIKDTSDDEIQFISDDEVNSNDIEIKDTSKVKINLNNETSVTSKNISIIDSLNHEIQVISDDEGKINSNNEPTYTSRNKDHGASNIMGVKNASSDEIQVISDDEVEVKKPVKAKDNLDNETTDTSNKIGVKNTSDYEVEVVSDGEVKGKSKNEDTDPSDKIEVKNISDNKVQFVSDDEIRDNSKNEDTNTEMEVFGTINKIEVKNTSDNIVQVISNGEAKDNSKNEDTTKNIEVHTANKIEVKNTLDGEVEDRSKNQATDISKNMEVDTSNIMEANKTSDEVKGTSCNNDKSNNECKENAKDNEKLEKMECITQFDSSINLTLLEDEVLVIADLGSNLDGSILDFQPHIEKESIKTAIEDLHLSLPEAFFLSYTLNCLHVLDLTSTFLSIKDMWILFQQSQPDFIEKYVTYHYFRAKGWVVKSGLKYGSDFLLYKKGPLYYHASYAVIVQFLNHEGKKVKENNSLTWEKILAVNRMAESANKDVLICQVMKPDLPEEMFLNPSVLKEFSVSELLMSRWQATATHEK